MWICITYYVSFLYNFISPELNNCHFCLFFICLVFYFWSQILLKFYDRNDHLAIYSDNLFHFYFLSVLGPPLFIFLWFSLPSSYVASLISWILCFPYSLVASWKNIYKLWNFFLNSEVACLNVFIASHTWMVVSPGCWILDWKLVSISWRLPFVIPFSFPPTLKDCRIFYLSLVFWYFMVFLQNGVFMVFLFSFLLLVCSRMSSPSISMHVHTDIHTVSPSMLFFTDVDMHPSRGAIFVSLSADLQTTCASQDVLGLESQHHRLGIQLDNQKQPPWGDALFICFTFKWNPQFTFD